MNSFDTIYNTENHFIKKHPGFLKAMFGTTDLVPLWIADMDFKVAEEITEEIHRIAERGLYSYEITTNEVIKAIIHWNQERHGLTLHPSSFIQVTTGVLTLLAILIQELTEKGAGIIIQTPVYHQFQKVIEANGRKVVDNPLKFVNNTYELDLIDLEEKMKRENVKVLIFCNPHNPVGRVWRKEEIGSLLRLADNYGVTVLSDEIHSDIVYEGAQFTSILSFEEAKNHFSILGSPAKTFGMHSIAHGYLYTAHRALYKKIKNVAESMYLHHGNAISGYATIAAYKKGGKWVDELVAYLAETNAWIEEYLKRELPKVKLVKPEGTYQVWLDFRALELSKEMLNDLIFKKAKLGLAPGEWFGGGNEQFMRMNIAAPRSVIQQAFRTLKTELLSL